MNKLKLCFSILLLVTGVSQAETSACNNFKITVKNDLSDDLVVRGIEVKGAKISPNKLQKLTNNSEQVFIIKNVGKAKKITGELTFNTISVPTKESTLKFELQNRKLACEHTDYSPKGDFALTKMRVPGKGVNYTISYN